MPELGKLDGIWQVRKQSRLRNKRKPNCWGVSFCKVIECERIMENPIIAVTPERSITVEPVALLYVSALLLQLPTYQHYLYHRAQVKLLGDGNNTDYAATNYCEKNVSSLNDKIQHEASSYILVIGLAGTFPAIFSTLLYGPLSDRKGRKPIMGLPPFGSLIDITITLFTIYYHLPVYVMAIGSAVGGVCGQYTTLVFTVTAYVADTTPNPSELSLRLTRLEAVALLGGTLAQATSGLWIEHLGYAAPYWFMFACHLATFLYIIFLLPESQKNHPTEKKTCGFKDLKLLAAVVVTKRKDRGRLRLISLFIASTLILLPTAVVNQLVILYSKNEPLCWNADLIGFLLASLFFARAIGAVFSMKVFRWLDWQDYSIAQIGTVSLMGLLVMIGLSTTTLVMFLTTILALLVGLPQPCVKAQMSHIVNSNEQGSLFSITASIESLCNFLGNIIFNPLYRTSLNFTWSHGNGFIFFINSGIAMLPVVIFSFLKAYHNRRKGYEAIEDIGNPKNSGTN